MAAAESELLMTTPYLIPGEEGMTLFSDLRKRNVRVRILTNSLESSTVLVAHSGYMGYRPPLLEGGVEIHEVRSLLGNARAGWVAAVTSNTMSVVSGGITCVAGVLVCVPLLPAFWMYRKGK